MTLIHCLPLSATIIVKCSQQANDAKHCRWLNQLHYHNVTNLTATLSKWLNYWSLGKIQIWSLWNTHLMFMTFLWIWILPMFCRDKGSLLSFVYKFGWVARRCCYLPPVWHHFGPASLPPERCHIFVYILEELTYLSSNIGYYHLQMRIASGSVCTISN